MTYPLISVIIPVYNEQSYLRACIESVLCQTYQYLEILLVDDGSTDDSPAICDSYLCDSRVRVFHRENLGLSSCRQFGIDNAKGDFVMTIDSDDYIALDCLETLIDAIMAAKADIAVCCRYDFLHEDNNIVNLLDNTNEVLRIDKQYIVENLDKLNKQVWLSDSWNKLYLLSFIKRSKVLFELDKKYNGNDLAFNYKLALHCPQYCIINKPLLYHRLTPNSMVRRKNKPLQEGFEAVLSQIINEARICSFNDSLSKQLSLLYSKMLLMTVLDIHKTSSCNRELRHRLSEMFKRDYSYRDNYDILNKLVIGNDIKSKSLSYLIKCNCLRVLCSLFSIHRMITGLYERKN